MKLSRDEAPPRPVFEPDPPPAPAPAVPTPVVQPTPVAPTLAAPALPVPLPIVLPVPPENYERAFSPAEPEIKSVNTRVGLQGNGVEEPIVPVASVVSPEQDPLPLIVAAVGIGLLAFMTLRK